MNQLWITTHGGKLEGLRSVSSSFRCNRHCKARAKNPDAICAKCYAENYLAMRKGLEKHLVDNYVWLQGLHEQEEFPRIDDEYFRLESFGDCASLAHARNFLRFAKANPSTVFACWTKNLGYYRHAISLEGKPRNFILVYSSPFVGKMTKVSEEDMSIVDHVFTVMPKGTPDEQITCGGRHCLSCMRCYRKGGDFEIRELIKGAK